MKQTLRYAPEALRTDYLRAGAGLALSLGPALAVPVGSPALYLLLPVAAMFAVFGLRTWRRHAARVEIDAEGISIFSGRRVSLPWNRVKAIKLSYYSTRADRTGGWMQLTLKGEDPQREGHVQALRFDSALESFEQVARLAAQAAAANGVPMPEATRANLAALGIAVGDGPAGAATARQDHG